MDERKWMPAFTRNGWFRSLSNRAGVVCLLRELDVHDKATEISFAIMPSCHTLPNTLEIPSETKYVSPWLSDAAIWACEVISGV